VPVVLYKLYGARSILNKITQSLSPHAEYVASQTLCYNNVTLIVTYKMHKNMS